MRRYGPVVPYPVKAPGEGALLRRRARARPDPPQYLIRWASAQARELGEGRSGSGGAGWRGALEARGRVRACWGRWKRGLEEERVEGGRLGERGCVSLGVGQWERGLDAHNLHEADRILKEAEPKMRAARMAYKAKPACTARIRPPDRDRVPSGACARACRMAAGAVRGAAGSSPRMGSTQHPGRTQYSPCALLRTDSALGSRCGAAPPCGRGRARSNVDACSAWTV